MNNTTLFLVAFLTFLTSSFGYAKNDVSNPIREGKYLLAQENADDGYDPFTDYSEFEEETDEEKDINFFKNGRFITLGFMFGPRGFTDTMSEKYAIAPTYGFYLSYFFDLRFALQFGYTMGDHSLQLASDAKGSDGLSTKVLKGIVSFNLLSVDFKYYFNTDNVTKGLAELNPYFIGGFSNVTRTISVTSLDGYGQDKATAIDFGGGIEIPLLRNKMYIGIQGLYHMITFKDEGSTITIDNLTFGTMSGDFWDGAIILGSNF